MKQYYRSIKKQNPLQMPQEDKWLTFWWLTWLIRMGILIFYCFLNNCMAIVQIKITSLISSLRQLPTKAIRKQNALGIVMLFPSLRDPYSKKGSVSHCLHRTFMSYLQCYDRLFLWHWNLILWDLAWIWQRILKKILFQEHFYDAASNSGYIAWRNKTVHRNMERRHQTALFLNR